ncbi:aldehyde dehydrogenase (NADP(+)) [Dyadobacter chenwenxiniae]|uniref:Aldehyde dehydrogenase (NADP(+)) n=1 Tax=Dyadobacter chenwenxiniae TaxID=2906456 RepID=A0A9X1PHF7_9BACT|nr:aldehyde dehydrogenase (NADP(+)) [Dyadobacter chenwenxiniae]MCF0060094.1 aldehyde dehydrogenase (NADP(+)) [Dyadobacter chenwenxiniae]UON85833.1 aldehyde dehydrogenase (NADP(+)) [Dyadobacter chenwenxiniae]
MEIKGKNYIGYSLSSQGDRTFQSYVPAKDAFLPETFHTATNDEVHQTMTLASKAFAEYAKIPAIRRADFLIAITEEILAIGDILLERASLETGLPFARLQGERARTINQLTQFAELLCEGSWVDASIDTALPDRQPVPKPDIRKMLVPIGPVIIFGSSNFPFAYSVAGVDTGPALAAGNPVVVKAHAAHPGVSDLTAQAIVKAAQRTGMPDGVFSMLYDDGFEVGTALVKHPASKAVGFTGSMKGGMALFKMAQERDEPIAVFAEMGSVNPIVVLPEYLENNALELGKTLAGSVSLGAGQFCTNPGLVFVTKTQGLITFTDSYKNEILTTTSATMLTAGICKNYYKLRDHAFEQQDVNILAVSAQMSGEENQAQASIATVSGKSFIANPKLHEEVFGPFSLLVICEDTNEMLEAIAHLKGQLTCSLMAEESEVNTNKDIVDKLSQISGRFILNGVPTGVEVCPSMHHGGPFPATADAKFTSVGRHSILRFVRPQSFQGWPDTLLPDELKNSNPLGIFRLVNNQFSKDAI